MKIFSFWCFFKSHFRTGYCSENIMSNVVIKFECPTTCILAGPSSSGKTTFLHKLLKQNKHMFQKVPKKIIYCYSTYQPIYDDIKHDVEDIEFFRGLPTKENMDLWALETGFKLLILDDMAQIASQSLDIVDLFTIYSHHKIFSVFFVVQNLFTGGKHFRTISLNSQYFVLFSNQRDKLQIQTLARQMFPGGTSFFMRAYKIGMERKKYSYLVVDFSNHSKPFKTPV